MDVHKNLNRILKDTAPVKEDKIINTVIHTNKISVMQIRDILIKIGKIQREILEENTYVAVIPGGFLKKNYAVVAIKLVAKDIYISAYADEGIIKQHTSEDAIDEFRRNVKQFIRE